MGTHIAGPPKALPRPPGTTITNHSVQFGSWAGYLDGSDPVAPIKALRRAFSDAGYQVGHVKTYGTAANFAFKNRTYDGTAYLGVLCTGKLRLLYQFDADSRFAPQVTTSTPEPATT